MRIFLIALLVISSSQAIATTYRSFSACTNFACRNNINTSLRDSEWQQVRNLLKAAGNPEEERLQIKQAIGLLETLVGEKTGTKVDLPGNQRPQNYRGQLDCTAEAINTTTYLRMLENDGLLRWHKVHDRVVRDRFWMVPHWTGVIEDTTTGVKYSVDSWFKKNGVAPVVVTLERWYNKK